MFTRGIFEQLVAIAALPTLIQGYSLPIECQDGIMETPTYGTNGAVFTICAANDIKATTDQIYEVILDFPRYDEWNTFVTSVDVPSNVTDASDVYVGMEMTLHTVGLIPGINTTSLERITLLKPEENPPFIAWEYDAGAASPITHAEHTSLLYPLPDGSAVRYVSWETYLGAGTVPIATLKPKLQQQFEVQGNDLKRRVEALYPGLVL